MLDSLGGGEKARVQGLAAAVLFHNFLALLKDAFDGFTRLGLRPASARHLLKPLDMLLLLVSVRQERLLQLPRFRGLRHFRQVLEDLTLGKYKYPCAYQGKDSLSFFSAMAKPPALHAYSTRCGRPCSRFKATDEAPSLHLPELRTGEELKTGA